MKNQQIENAIAFAFLCKTQGAYKIAHDYIRVRQLAKRLANIDVHNCNGTRFNGENGETEYQQAIDRISIVLKTLLDPLKLEYYHQSDPRGNFSPEGISMLPLPPGHEIQDRRLLLPDRRIRRSAAL